MSIKHAEKEKFFPYLLASKRAFVIPTYQRGYSWQEEHLIEYWDDIFDNVYKAEEGYFIGSIIVCNSSATKKTDGIEYYDVIDGQQRILTSILFLRAIFEVADSIDYRDAEQKIFKEYLFTRAKSSDEGEKRVRVSKADERIFNNYIFAHKIPSRNEKSILRTPAIKARDFFRKKLKDFVDSVDEQEERHDLIDELLKRIEAYLEVVVVHTSNDVDAYSIFETLNSKGKDLTPSELLKNFFFSSVDENNEKLDTVQESWEYISDDLRDGEVSETNFIRHYWISKYSPVSDKKLYKVIKQRIAKDKIVKVEDLIKSLGVEVPNYLYINVGFKDEFTETSTLVSQINELGIIQCYPLLLSLFATSKIDETEKVNLLKRIVYISLRRGISGKNPNELESFYVEWSPKVRQLETIPHDLYKDLSKLDVEEEEFKKYFTTTSINSKFAKFILKRIEESKATDEHKPLYKVELEHIMPRNPRTLTDWGVDELFHEQKLETIGNFTLLGKRFNQVISNSDFNRKHQEYVKSELKVTQDLAREYIKWDPSIIDERAETIYKDIQKIYS